MAVDPTQVAPADGGTTADGSVDAGGGASEDASAEASPTGTDGGLLANGNFEMGCLGWSGFEASLFDEPNGRSGKACRVCRRTDSPQTFYYIVQSLSRAFVPGERFVATAWVRKTDDVQAHPLEITVIAKDTADREVDYTASSPVPLSSSFASVSVLHTTTSDAGIELVVRFGVDFVAAGTPSCFIIDDASLSPLR